eukprot:TRINITY_DN15092_c0_g1_i1.p2 TRINITY_DN15092_c0_g1~~TRINITY_DN15092_c0_g1_i1.p2  ORF type:complete len:195 (+),score=47.92 TRINITY_DN15092_c0_g1_i1:1062-1646(+)
MACQAANSASALQGEPHLWVKFCEQQVGQLTVGTTNISCHSFILCLRSPVFRAMLGSKMLEGTSKAISLEDVDVDVAEAFVQFLYRDDMEVQDYELCICLLELAHKYDVQSLVALCEWQLLETLDASTAVRTLMVADTLVLSTLKAGVLSFLVDHGQLPSAQRSCSWPELSKKAPHLAVELLERLAPAASCCEA